MLNRDKPKKVIYYQDREDGYLIGEYYECPNCHVDLEDWQIEHEANYCNECGQALDWEDDED